MWTFSNLPGLGPALDKLVDAIDTQGRRFMESLDERRALASALRGDLRNSMVFRLPGDAAGARTSPQSNLARRYVKVRYARGSDPFATEYAAFRGA